MVNGFIFFHGPIKKMITTVWHPDGGNAWDIATELTTLLSEEISREIDEGVVREMTRRINGGERNLDYLNRWINIGN